MCWKIAVVWMGGCVCVLEDCGCVDGWVRACERRCVLVWGVCGRWYKSVCVCVCVGGGGGGGECIGRWVWMCVGGASVGVCDMHLCVCGTCTCTYSIIAVYFKLL